MIIYQASKEDFIRDIDHEKIEKLIYSQFLSKTGHHVGKSEQNSWKRSMHYMRDVLDDVEIPNTSGVTIEYQIPQTSKRIDFILTGQDGQSIDNAVLIELKQWSEAMRTDKDGIVLTQFFGEVAHPSYQVWSYASLLENFNTAVYEDGIKLRPCAYLHNYIKDDTLTDDFYQEYLNRAPIFFMGDSEKTKLREFIKLFVKHGDRNNIMYCIDGGRIRPSKSLADSLSSMLAGNQEFVMVDDQKLVYETALQTADRSNTSTKEVLIVQGGPGTGKSVVAINLLVALTKKQLVTQYVTKNSAPRTVYESMLTGTMRRTEISNLFSGSGSYINVPDNIFDVLVVDEAHRLNAKSGMFKNLGENQIKEIMAASKLSIFFIDEDQRVTWHDIGTSEEIERWAAHYGANVQKIQLASQFRCNGSDGYLAWLDDVLQINETANQKLGADEYDFRVFNSPNDLRDEIINRNAVNNKARLVAGYCWNWVSKKVGSSYDIDIPEHNFKMRWNLASDGNLWILSPKSVNEAGCIHTCQGLETDYIGVIIGPDLIVRDGVVITNPDARAKSDASLNGYRKELRVNPTAAKHKADLIIKNTYRTLMTRGQKGCYIYCTDKETASYFQQHIT